MFFISDCNRLRKLLWDAAAGTLGESDSARVNSHITLCDKCRQELEAYRQTVSLVAGFRSDAIPESRMRWRDVERRVAAQQAGTRGWSLRPLLQFGIGGAAVAVASVLVLALMQSNLNRPGVKTVSGTNSPGGVARNTDISTIAVDEGQSPFSLSVLQVPHISDDVAVPLRTARPTAARMAVRGSRAVQDRHNASPQVQVASMDVNVDGGGAAQQSGIRPESVLPSASSGRDDDQTSRVIDVVSASSSSTSSDAAEDSHPW